MKLKEESLIPLYQQLIEEIKRSIEDGKYRYDEKIPTEPELSEIYSVSRITVRRAVNELCEEGYLVKRQGKGTYVRRSKIHRKIISKVTMSFSDVCKENGMKHSVKVINCQHVPARRDECLFLDIPSDSPLLFTQRVHSADGLPVQIENNFYPLDRFSFLESEDLNDRSLFHTLSEKYNIKEINSTDAILEIVLASTEHAQLLQVPVGEPLFYLNTYFVDEDNNPLFVGRSYIVGSRYTMHI